MLKNKRIFISGGAGVIGRELVAELQRQGAVILVGDLKSKPKEFSADILYRQGDLNTITKAELEMFSPEIFFHLAATFERSTESYEFWQENFWHNVHLSNHLMTVLKDLPSLKRVVFASSYLIYKPELYLYPEAQQSAFRLSESEQVQPRNLTGDAKFSHEIELEFLNSFKADQFTSVCARIFRGYGKGSRCVISRWIRDLLQGKAIKVFCKDGMFDYIYAGEIAQGLIKLAGLSDITGIINLGNDNARKVEDVVNILRDYFPAMVVTEEDSDIAYEASQANMDFFKQKVGWTPKLQLEDTIGQIIEYEKQLESAAANPPVAKNILLTSVSAKVPLLEKLSTAANKLDKEITITGADINPDCIAKHFVDEFWQVPAAADLSAELIINYCQDNGINALIPTRDGELQFFAEIKTTLAQQGIAVMVSDHASVTTCLDKLLFSQHPQILNIIPGAEDIDELPPCTHYVVKERFGAGADKIGLELTSEAARAHGLTLESPLYQPYIAGDECSIDMYIDQQSNLKGIIMRKRVLVVNGESQVTRSFYDEKLESFCQDFVSHFNFYGHIILQIMQDDDGNLHVIECNPRFGGASTLSVQLGLDSFYWFLLEAAGEDITTYPFVHDPNTVATQVRYAKDVIEIGIV